MSGPVVIAAAARTPVGRFQGSLASLSCVQLGAAAAGTAVRRAGLPPAAIDQLHLGCVLTAGLGPAPARQAAAAARLPPSVQTATVSKLAGSGLLAVIIGHDALRAGSAGVVIAGGMESMSNAPYLLAKYRRGARAGQDRARDSMYVDGVEEPPAAGDDSVDADEDCRFTQEERQAYHAGSTARAQAALHEGAFAEELVPVERPGRKGRETIAIDEILHGAEREPGRRARAPATYADGAAALLLMREGSARELGCAPLGRVVAHAAYGGDPRRLAAAPALAIRELLARAGWRAGDVDLFEIGDAAAAPMMAVRELGIGAARVNVHGGSDALGEPLGASGARLLVTLLHALRRRRLRRGVAAIGIAGGEALAIAVEAI